MRFDSAHACTQRCAALADPVPSLPFPPSGIHCQERLRQQQLESLKAWQAKQEKEAQARPEAKRWIDPAIIDRCALPGHPIFGADGMGATGSKI